MACGVQKTSEIPDSCLANTLAQTGYSSGSTVVVRVCYLLSARRLSFMADGWALLVAL
jgi:hypothetical protein